jgi:hypothetical protein
MLNHIRIYNTPHMGHPGNINMHLSLVSVFLFLTFLDASIFDLEPANDEIERILNKRSRSISSTQDDCRSFSQEIISVDLNADDLMENYAQQEKVLYGFQKMSDIGQIYKAINFIISDDLSGYHAYFESKCNILLLERNGIRGYFAHYFVRFGAVKFIESVHPSIFSRWDILEFEEAFEFLIQSKPLLVVLNVLSHIRFIKAKHMKSLIKSIKNNHPELHFLDYLAFELRARNEPLITYTSQLLRASGYDSKLSVLTQILMVMIRYPPGSGLEFLRLVEIPIRYPSYFSGLADEIRFFIAQLSICNGNLEVFELIIDQDPQFLLQTLPLTALIVNCPTLFHLAVYFKQTHFMPFFMDTVPEIATSVIDGNISPFYLAVTLQHIEIIKAFESSGITFEQKIVYEMKNQNALQYAFSRSLPVSFEYFSSKIDRNEALGYIFSIFHSEENILAHALKKHSVHDFAMARLLVDKFGFNLTSTRYYIGTLVGTAVIFVKPEHVSDFELEFGSK